MLEEADLVASILEQADSFAGERMASEYWFTGTGRNIDQEWR